MCRFLFLEARGQRVVEGGCMALRISSRIGPEHVDVGGSLAGQCTQYLRSRIVHVLQITMELARRALSR
ncbi:hypothetical protein ASD82_04955 [Rhodanobacter sp. Root179]|nr:hypothetical protein ASD82_04955 [Rhodanobacter sp. Root179]